MLINYIVIIFFLISIFYTFKYRFIQFKAFKVAKKVLFKDKSKSAYQTFMVSLASHIGTGNVVGITSSLIVGGVGSLFWMWMYAIFSSIFSLMENTLGQVYKQKIDGEYRGGSSYYIYKGLNKKYIALLIAIFLVLSNTIFFQPLQVNTISESIYLTTNIPRTIIFILIALFTIFVIFKGTKKIVRFSEFIVPIMSLGYLTIGLVIIVFNFSKTLDVINLIFTSAFKKESIIGGALYVGMRRSLFSHEAGLGTMPTICAMSEVEKPIEQGYISCLGVFIDTLLISSITGFMVLIYNFTSLESLTLYEGCDLIIYVFINIFGKIGSYLAVFFMISFALATVVSQYYLGESNLLFITKDKKKFAILIYRLLFLIGIFLGVFAPINSIWEIIDIGMILLGLVNLYSIIKLEKVFKENLIVGNID